MAGINKLSYIRLAFPGIILLLGISINVSAQTTEKWDLRRCIDYAMKNSISVRQADITARSSEIALKQSKLAQIPSLNFNVSNGFSFGRTLDRTTNVYVSRSAMFQQLSLQSNAVLFNFNSQRNAIEANKYTLEADKASIDKARNDIGLLVAQQYLRALLSKEQVELSRVVLHQTQFQLDNTRKLVDAGSLPELNAAELEATEARDSATVIQTNAQYELDLLSLKALLNLPADHPFELETPPVEKIPVDNILEQDPAAVFAMAMNSQPQIKSNNLRVIASEKTLASRKGQLYPTLSIFSQLNSNFNQFFLQTTGFNVTGETPLGTFAKLGATNLPVYAPTGTSITENRNFGQLWQGYGQQLNDQLGKGIGLTLNVPIFNGWQARANVERAKLDIERNKLSIERDTLQLKQDVYNAYQSALGAYQTYLARVKAVQTAERSFELASKRYNIGVMQTIEWLTNQNNLTRARIDKMVAQYDYVFRMKVLEFYKGQGLRL
jgi:outer membrane protein